jgi:hypothetical protein
LQNERLSNVTGCRIPGFRCRISCPRGDALELEGGSEKITFFKLNHYMQWPSESTVSACIPCACLSFAAKKVFFQTVRYESFFMQYAILFQYIIVHNAMALSVLVAHVYPAPMILFVKNIYEEDRCRTKTHATSSATLETESITTNVYDRGRRSQEPLFQVLLSCGTGCWDRFPIHGRLFHGFHDTVAVHPRSDISPSPEGRLDEIALLLSR